MARNIGVNFNGQRIIHPSAHAKIDASALNSVGTSTDKIVAIVGNADAGEPNVVHTITSSSEAVEIFKGGDLVKACELAFNPSGDGYGAGTILAMRTVSGGANAQLDVNGLLIKAKDDGKLGNNIHISLNLTNKVLKVTNIKTGDIEVFNGIGDIFKVAGGSVTISATNVTVGDAELTINEDTTVADVIEFLYLEDVTAKLTSSLHKNMLASELEPKTYADGEMVTAKKGDIINQAKYSNLITIEEGTDGTLADINQMLAGGVDGTLTISADVLAELNNEGAYIIVPLTDDEAVQGIVHDYVAEQSTDERSLMLGVYGGDLNETVEEVIERALSFSSQRAIVAYPPILKATTDENPEKLPSYFTACLIAGRIAGKETGDPITLDTVNINGLATNLSKADINKLLEAGVTTLEFVRNSGTKGYRIAQGLTTYQANTNPNYREIAMCTVSDELVGELVERLETNFVGGKGTANTVALIKNDVQSFLDQKVREEVIVSYDVESVQIELRGDVVYVTFACTPVGAINYILITTKYQQASLLA